MYFKQIRFAFWLSNVFSKMIFPIGTSFETCKKLEVSLFKVTNQETNAKLDFIVFRKKGKSTVSLLYTKK